MYIERILPTVIFILQGEKSNCDEFLDECSILCGTHILHAECWGSPLYACCQCTDGIVIEIPGFACEHPNCGQCGKN